MDRTEHETSPLPPPLGHWTSSGYPRWVLHPEQVLHANFRKLSPYDEPEQVPWSEGLSPARVIGCVGFRSTDDINDIAITTCEIHIYDEGAYRFMVLWTPSPEATVSESPVQMEDEWIEWVGVRHLVGNIFYAEGWIPVHPSETDLPVVWKEKNQPNPQ